MAPPQILPHNHNNNNNAIRKPPKQLICFSFAAYAKRLISDLRSSGVPVSAGLSDVEFSSVESLLSFTFPPDLRAILREGLPLATGFPDWRSSSPQHLRVLLNLPLLTLLKQVSSRSFWADSWGPRPDDLNLAVESARNSLRKSPILVPIFRNFYIPCSQGGGGGGDSGNPVFRVDAEGGVRIASFDITGFFKDFELLKSRVGSVTGAPVWAAKAAKRIDFWTEAAERGKFTAAGGAWWSGELGACLEEVFRRLREGGWEEEEVREMLMMTNKKKKHHNSKIDGCNLVDRKRESNNPTAVIELEAEEEVEEKKGVTWHVGMLSLVLLRAGWTREDVVYSLDLRRNEKDVVVSEGKSQSGWCSKLKGHRETRIKRV